MEISILLKTPIFNQVLNFCMVKNIPPANETGPEILRLKISAVRKRNVGLDDVKMIVF